MPASVSLVNICATLVTAAMGLVAGAAASRCAWAWVHDASMRTAAFRCASCGRPLALRPLAHRCPVCGHRVAMRGPAELVLALAWATLLWRFGPSPELAQMAALAVILLMLSLTDLLAYVIPNWAIVAAIVVRLAYIALAGARGTADDAWLLLGSLASAVAITLPLVLLTLLMDRALGRDSLGGGDVKLFFATGLYFGLGQGLLVVALSCLLGLVFHGLLLLAGRLRAPRGEPPAGEGRAPAADAPAEVPPHAFPFGPAIACACWVVALLGPSMMDWYLSLLA